MNNVLRAAPRPSVVRAFGSHNPFYLLSALCMLGGLFALNNSLNFSPLPARNLLDLILVLNVYEILLIGIGIFLARRGLMRDAATLLVLEAVFLADAGFLNAEAFGQDFSLGLAINVFLFVFAAAKLVVIFIGLRIPLSDRRLFLALSLILILLAIPGFLKQVSEGHDGRVPPLGMFPLWWVVGLIPILSVLFLRQSDGLRYRGIIFAFILFTTLSILAHLATANWVYKVRWQYANLSPLILGLAVGIGASDWHARSVTVRMWTHLLLPMVAILIATPDYPPLDFWMGDVAMTPLRLTLLAAAVVYLAGLMVHRHVYFGLAGTICLGIAGIGHSPEAMTDNTVALGDRILAFLKRLIPRTLSQ